MEISIYIKKMVDWSNKVRFLGKHMYPNGAPFSTQASCSGEMEREGVPVEVCFPGVQRRLAFSSKCLGIALGIRFK